jgi:hypothetical protein
LFSSRGGLAKPELNINYFAALFVMLAGLAFGQKVRQAS